MLYLFSVPDPCLTVHLVAASGSAGIILEVLTVLPLFLNFILVSGVSFSVISESLSSLIKLHKYSYSPLFPTPQTSMTIENRTTSPASAYAQNANTSIALTKKKGF